MITKTLFFTLACFKIFYNSWSLTLKCMVVMFQWPMQIIWRKWTSASHFLFLLGSLLAYFNIRPWTNYLFVNIMHFLVLTEVENGVITSHCRLLQTRYGKSCSLDISWSCDLYMHLKDGDPFLPVESREQITDSGARLSVECSMGLKYS